MDKDNKRADKIAAKYTHSVWSGKAYDRPQTQAELIAESKAVIAAYKARRAALARVKGEA